MLLITNSYSVQGDTVSYGGVKNDLTEYNKSAFKIIQCQPGVKDCIPETKAKQNNQISQSKLIPLIKKYGNKPKDTNMSVINYHKIEKKTPSFR